MSIYNAADALLHTWTMTSADAIATVGGNRYGWIVFNENSFLAIDNAELDRLDTGAVPEPISLAVWSALAAGVGAVVWVKRRAA